MNIIVKQGFGWATNITRVEFIVLRNGSEMYMVGSVTNVLGGRSQTKK